MLYYLLATTSSLAARAPNSSTTSSTLNAVASLSPTVKLFEKATSTAASVGIFTPNATLLSSPGQQSLLYGRTSGYDAGTTANYYVDNVNGSNTNAGTFAAPFATIQKAFDVSTGGGKTIAVRDSGQPYLESVTSSLSNMTVKGYGTEQPKWYGAYKVTGFTQCTIADQPMLGSNYASIYKANITLAGNINHTAYHGFMPLENGSPLNLCQIRHDTSDLFFQDNSDAFYASSKWGDGVTISSGTFRQQKTLTRGGTAGGSDTISSSTVTSIVAVNQGGIWNGTSFTGGTNYLVNTDFIQSGNAISWSPSGAEPTSGASYTVIYDQTGIKTITHPSILGNGTTPYTEAQLNQCGVMVHVSPNLSQFYNVTDATGGILTIDVNTDTKETANGDCYALLNILPEMKQGQFGYTDNGDGTLTLFVWPNNVANLSSGLLVAANTTALTFSNCSNPNVQNFEFGMTCDTSKGEACVHYDTVTGGVFKQCTIRFYSHKEKGYGAFYLEGSSSTTLQYCTFRDGQNSFGPFFSNAAGTSSGNRLLNCYMYKIAQSPWRMYGQLLIAVVDNKAESCGFSAHANKGNFYDGCDQALCLRNWWIMCGGFLTNQGSSRMLFLMNLCPADPVGTTTDSFRDQTKGQDPTNTTHKPPTDPSSNYHINNAYPKMKGNTGIAESLNVDCLTILENPTFGNAWHVNWGLFNNVAHGIGVQADHQLAGSPNFNLLMKDVGSSASSVLETNYDNLFYDYSTGNWNTVPNSLLLTTSGTDVTSYISSWEGWFPDIDLRKTLNGFTWNPADPGIGPYGKNWPIEPDVTAPTLSSLSATITGASAACTVTTNERGGNLYWVRYNGLSAPSRTQVVNGQNSTGSAALSSGNVLVGEAGVQNAFTVSGTSGQTDTLAVVHKDRNGNISSVVTTSLAFTSYSPQWVAFDGVHFLTRSSSLVGYQPTTKNMFMAFTVSRNASQLITSTSGGIFKSNNSSISAPTYGPASTSKMSLKQEDTTDAVIVNAILPSVSMGVDVQYLILAGFTSSAAAGWSFKASCVRVSDGLVIGSNVSLGNPSLDTSLVFNHFYKIFGAAETNERFMLWDNTYVDPTSTTIQRYFVQFGGGLVDPTTAMTNIGSPIICLYGSGLSTGANSGTGGNFTFG